MSSSVASMFSASLLEEIRDRFAWVESDPYAGQRVYFENAGGSLTLKTVLDTVAHWTAIPDNAGRKTLASQKYAKVMQQAREGILSLLGASSGTIALSESTTNNAFRVLGSIIANVPGDNVVTTKLDHPSLYDSTRILAERTGKQWRVADLCADTGIVQPEAIAKLIDSKTVVLSVIHSSNNLGTINDVRAIIEAARDIKPDLHVLIDGAQYTPHGFVDIDSLGCDAYLVSSYKTFGKPGASVVWMSPRVAELPHDQLLGKAATDWELGTREPAGYAAWCSVIEYLCWLGSKHTASSDTHAQLVAAMGAIAGHEQALAHRLLHGEDSIRGMIDIPNVEVYGEKENLVAKDPAFAFNVGDIPSDEIVSLLRDRGIIVYNRISDAYSTHTLNALGIKECVRVSLSHYNTPGEVDLFLNTLAEIAS